MTKDKEQNIKLVLDSSVKYSLIVRKSLENKIRYLCGRFWDKEYSGVLFYKVHGNIGDNDFTVECVDFCLCDIGSSTYTEFETKPEIVTYMCDNDLVGCYTGLLHSHNNMSTFFSGTDVDTLKAEGSSMPHFVSLIVNNKGEYTAAITSRVTRHFTGVVNETVDTFGNTIIPQTPVSKEFSDTCVKYNYLNVSVERDPWYADVENKISGVEEAKKKSKTTKMLNNSSYMFDPAPIQLKMFDTDDQVAIEEEPWEDISEDEMCEELLIKAFNFGKKTRDKTLIQAMYSFMDTEKKYSPGVAYDKLKDALKKEVCKVSGSSIKSSKSSMLLCSLTDYLDNMSVDGRLFEKELGDVIDKTFDILVDFMEK